jgi:squalene-hopene/tetraprenyl-beta-curcumene cyclase
LAQAIAAVYGKDRTFSVPILVMCALAGRFGAGRGAWRSIPALPFELAACPRAWYHRLGLGVVSYALPALIAVGQARHYHRPTRNPITRCLRGRTRERTLRILKSIQPGSGGFLEATPLTSFVVMSLASIGQVDHPVVERGRAFLTASIRQDGSWPIDTNLATWVTTLSVKALGGGGDLAAHLSTEDQAAVRTWLYAQQYKSRHPYTGAAPGGWAWTDRSGGVPDADDTAGALLALWHLAVQDGPNRVAGKEDRCVVSAGVRWLLDLQNEDGGIPTFCRGWGRLPFDRSSPDLTAHALQAWHTWRGQVPHDLGQRVDRAILRAVAYLSRVQRLDGSWTPLWFGNQHAADQLNPLYGTTSVLRGAEAISVRGRLRDIWSRARRRAVEWVVSVQNPDGGWGGAPSVASSIEETALAVEALAGATESSGHVIGGAIDRGCAWLRQRTDGGSRFAPTPIGLYFAKLWYAERLYPLIFTVAALERVHGLRRACSVTEPSTVA